MPAEKAVGRPAVALKKMTNIAKIIQAFGMATNGDDSSTTQCTGRDEHCIALHCQKIYGKLFTYSGVT
jgi:hypothetical protein